MQVALATFATYVLVNLNDKSNRLTADKAFVALSLFNILRLPLVILPMVISSTVEASVSVKRLVKFLKNPELDPANVDYSPRPPRDGEEHCYHVQLSLRPDTLSTQLSSMCVCVQVRMQWKSIMENSHGKLPRDVLCHSQSTHTHTRAHTHTPHTSCLSLPSINLKVKPGQLVAIVGQVGAGKSSLLSAMLGEMERVQGNVSVRVRGGGGGGGKTHIINP